MLLVNGFTVFYSGKFTVSGFFTAYVGILLFLILYLGHKFFTKERKEPWMHKPEAVDLISDVAEVEADAEMWTNLEASEKEDRLQANGVWKRFAVLWE